jgi:hypothetical protein
MTTLQTSSARLVWQWCRVYTAIAPTAHRERRCEEIHAHLWDSEQAKVPRRRVVLACAKGALHDLNWALGLRLRQAVAALTTPSPYVALAAVAVLCGAFSSAVVPAHQQWRGTPVELIGLLVAVASLAVAAVIMIRRRRD